MADAPDLRSGFSDGVGVQVPLDLPNNISRVCGGMADTPDSNPGAERREGSSPSKPTNFI